MVQIYKKQGMGEKKINMQNKRKVSKIIRKFIILMSRKRI